MEARGRSRYFLLSALIVLFIAHAALLVFRHDAPVASNFIIAMIAMLAASCLFWRGLRLPAGERAASLWMGVAIGLWSVGQLIATVHNDTGLANNPVPKLEDFFYFVCAIPYMLAISGTQITREVRSTHYANILQALVASGLVYVFLFDPPVTPKPLGTFIVWELCFLTAAAIVRYAASTSPEDRRSLRMVCIYLCVYSLVEVATDEIGRQWDLPGGTLLDLPWSLPFLVLGGMALRLPIDSETSPRRMATEQQVQLLIQSLCPMAFTGCVVVLAVFTVRQHTLFALSAVILSFLAQGLHSGFIQLDSLLKHDLLEEQQRQLARANTELAEANANLERLSFLDPLTGIPNRRYFAEAFEAEWRRAVRQGEWIAMLMIDIDFFKAVNDRHGHVYGDKCINQVAGALQTTVGRGTDIVVRYGGEEFVVLLAGTPLAGAMHVAQRVQSAVGSLELRNDASPFGGLLTVSIGVVALKPKTDSSSALLTEAADQALYRAKRQGRNQICVAEGILHQEAS